MPGCFVKGHGKGRVCVITLGHNLAVWHESGFRKLLSNALLWCCGSEVA
jgi:type 1 glutamine amidotransferase